MSSSGPPNGPYVPIEDGIQLVQLLRQGGPVKYLRLSSHSVFRIPREGLNPAAYTAAVIDCQGQWIDMRGMDSYAVQPLSKLSFFSCTISSPDSDAAWAADTSFHGCNIVHPCEATTPQIIGNEASDENMPIKFELETIEKDSGFQESWINSTITCLTNNTGFGADGGLDAVVDGGGKTMDTWQLLWPWLVAAAAGVVVLGLVAYLCLRRRRRRAQQRSQASWNQKETAEGTSQAGTPMSLKKSKSRSIDAHSRNIEAASPRTKSLEAMPRGGLAGGCSARSSEAASRSFTAGPAGSRSPGTRSHGTRSPGTGSRHGSFTSALHAQHGLLPRSTSASANAEDQRTASQWPVSPHVPSPPGTPGTPHANSWSSSNSDLAFAMQTTVSQFKRELPDVQLEILQHIGTGGYGSVYRGIWKGLEVAIKTVVFQDRDEDGTAERVFKEAAIACNMSHEHIVNSFTNELKRMPSQLPNELVDYKLYIIQEFCQGGSLAKLLSGEHLVTPAGGVHIQRVLTILRHVASGVSYMHSALRCIHGDLNPSNILLQLDNKYVQTPRKRRHSWKPLTKEAARGLDDGSCTVKLGDFGLTVQLQHGRTHVSNVKQGTPFYTAPELAQQNRLLCASDVYSFGVLMWECYHNTPPYDVENDQYILNRDFGRFPSIAPLNYVLLAAACLSPAPEDRPSFVGGQVVEVLAAIGLELASGFYTDMRGGTQPVTILGKKPPDSDLLEAEDVWHVAEAHAQAHSAVFSVTSSLHPQQTQSSRRTASSGPTSNSAAVQGCDLDAGHTPQETHVDESELTLSLAQSGFDMVELTSRANWSS